MGTEQFNYFRHMFRTISFLMRFLVSHKNLLCDRNGIVLQINTLY